MAQNSPEIAQDGHKMAQDGLKTAPKWPKMASSSPRWPQTGPKRFQDRSKMGHMGQDGSKIDPTRLQNCFPTPIFTLTFFYLFSFSFLSFFLSFPFFPFLSFPFLSNRMGGLPKAIYIYIHIFVRMHFKITNILTSLR